MLLPETCLRSAGGLAARSHGPCSEGTPPSRRSQPKTAPRLSGKKAAAAVAGGAAGKILGEMGLVIRGVARGIF